MTNKGDLEHIITDADLPEFSSRPDEDLKLPSVTATAMRQTGHAKDVLDVDDLANLFSCSCEKIKRMARSGELPAFKFGRCWYVRRNDLERFLSDRVESSRHLRRIQEVSP